jgi:hypothetical protein
VKYWVRTLLGLAICGAALVAVNWAIYNLVRAGTCASGGPYVSARPCPPGTGGQILALVGGIFAGTLGVAVYATRGDRGRAGFVGLGIVMWSLLFLTLAASSLLGAFGPAADDDRDDSKTGAVIMSAIFVPMGLAPLLFAFRTRGKAEQSVPPVLAGTPNVFAGTPHVLAPQPVWPLKPPAAGATPSPPVPPEPDDPLERLEKLGELRAAGVLTDEEFEAQKRKLLGEL